jgi:hypothetical protein
MKSGADAKRSPGLLGQCSVRSVCWVVVFGVRASVGRTAANPSRFPPSDPVREAGGRTNNAPSHRRAHRHLPLCCASAFVDERRIVGGDGGGRGRAGNAHLALRASVGRATAKRAEVPAGRSGSRGWRWSSTDNALFTSPCSSPHSVALRPHVAARWLMSGVSIQLAWPELARRALFAPACASSPSVALRPRAAARSPMNGASWRATADGCRGPRTATRHALPRQR